MFSYYYTMTFFYRYMKHSNKKYKTRAKKNKETITKEKLEKKETIQTKDKNILKFILWIPLAILESILGYDIDFNILRKIIKWGISIIWIVLILYIIIEYVSLKIIIFWWIIVIIILLIIILKRIKEQKNK